MKRFPNTLLRMGCLTTLITLLASASAYARIWTDSQGRKVNGTFVRVFQGNVVLKVGVKTLSVPFESLSAEDQEYLRKDLEAKGKGDLLPTPRASARLGGTQGKGMGLNLDPGNRNVDRTGSAMSGSGRPYYGQGPAATDGSRPSGYSGGATPYNYPSSSGQGSTPYNYPSPSGQGSTPYNYPSPSGQGSTPSNYPYSSGQGSTPSPSGGAMPSGGGPSPVPPLGGAGPSIPIPMGPQMVEVKRCMNCNREVPDSTKAGDRCPHCFVHFDYEDLGDGRYMDDRGNITRTRPLARGAAFGGGIVGVVFVIALLLRLVGLVKR